jgi:hypothetical protein
VVEHVDDGYAISGVTPRIAQAPEELRAAFNMGRANRDMQVQGAGPGGLGCWADERGCLGGAGGCELRLAAAWKQPCCWSPAADSPLLPLPLRPPFR